MSTKTLKRELIAAIAMVLVAAVALSGSTFAWFAMNTQVSATGAKVQAVAEDGILIINELDTDQDANWKSSTQSTYASQASLAPTSTADVTNWYHNSSTDQNDAMANQAASTYETLSSDTNWLRDEGSGKTGVYYINSDGVAGKGDADKAYVLLNKFYIKSSGNAIPLGSDKTYKALYVNKIEVADVGSSAALDASLRIAVKIGNTITIYAPVTGATTSYKVAGTTNVVAEVPDANGIVNTAQGTDIASIPARSTAKAGAVEADVYVYFEGEDAGLKSSNLQTTLDTLKITVTFGITELPTT